MEKMWTFGKGEADGESDQRWRKRYKGGGWRLFRSGGHAISEKLAEKLGYAYYDLNMLEVAASRELL